MGSPRGIGATAGYAKADGGGLHGGGSPGGVYSYLVILAWTSEAGERDVDRKGARGKGGARDRWRAQHRPRDQPRARGGRRCGDGERPHVARRGGADGGGH